MPDTILRTTSREAFKVAASMLDATSRMTLGNVRHSLEGLRYASHGAHALLEGGLVPAVDSMVTMNEQVVQSVTRALRGEDGWRDALGETVGRVRSGARFARLVDGWGKELFGSATFAGEVVLAEDEHFRLVYIPPAEGVTEQPVAIFHAGGAIPYGDRIFRLLPEINFYDRFRERGLGVYAMELRGDRHQANCGRLTMDALVDATAHLSSLAREHAGAKKLVLEGYCGHGTQALVYLAAMPEDAAQKFAAFVTFVSPIDGSKCDALASAVQVTPDRLLELNMSVWGAFGGYVPGESTQLGIDMPLKAVFYKTPLGYFSMGWQRTDLGAIERFADLGAAQKRDLAGTYWVSPDNARRFPIPVDLSRFTVRLFKQGLGRRGELPWSYRGRPLSLADVVEKTRFPLLGFYGGKDAVVPDKTAHALVTLFGPRYTHVVHPEAGHISYVLSPDMWAPKGKRVFAPNPIDLLLAKLAA